MDIASGKYLPVMEEFYSLQGEGFHTGKAAYFIRIGGCDVGCHWCDVKEAWDASLWAPKSVEEVVYQAMQFKARSVVITGGEPLMYNLDFLCAKLKECGFEIFLETSGAYPLSGQFDWICLSPKRNHPPEKGMFALANELKVIIENEKDFSWAGMNAEKVGADCLLFLQPEWSRSKQMMPVIVEYIQEHPQWRISLQSHKYMHIP